MNAMLLESKPGLQGHEKFEARHGLEVRPPAAKTMEVTAWTKPLGTLMILPGLPI